MSADEVMAAEPAPFAAASAFSLDRANRALVLVRKVVAEIMAGYRELTELRVESDRLRAAATDQPQVELVQDRLEACALRLKRLAAELTRIGCVLKDCRTGLVDFPAVYRGRRVWLCWRYNEPQVGHWHELDDGYPGRKPAGDDFR